MGRLHIPCDDKLWNVKFKFRLFWLLLLNQSERSRHDFFLDLILNIYLSQLSRLWYHFLNYSKNLKFALEISKFVNLVDVKQSDILKNNLAYALEWNKRGNFFAIWHVTTACSGAGSMYIVLINARTHVATFTFPVLLHHPQWNEIISEGAFQFLSIWIFKNYLRTVHNA